MAHKGVAQEKALRLMLRPAADHRVHQDYISDHLELTGERKEEEEDSLTNSMIVLTLVRPCAFSSNVWQAESEAAHRRHMDALVCFPFLQKKENYTLY